MKIYRNNIELYDLVIDDRTKLSKKLMAEDKVLFDYCSPVKLDIQVDDYLLTDGIKYTLNRPAKEQKVSLTEYRYTGEFEAPIYFLLDKLYLLNDSSEFYLVGTAEDFIDLLITNMNSIHPEWSKGIISNTDRKNLSFNSVNCGEALNQIASQFNLEYEITDKQISLKERIENETALSFEHGKGKGLYNLSREAVDDENTVTRAFVFGSSRNLEYTYRGGANRLIFENANGTHYLENTSEYNRIVEKTVVFEDIWPRFTGVINSVSADKKTISCNSIDFNLNDQLLSGITAKIVFLSGDLMGFTFEIAIYDHSTKVIRLNSVTKEAGLLLPDPATFFPSPGDQFTFIDIKMPQTYVDNAEALLKTEGQKWLDYYSQLRVKYSLTLDHRYLRDHNISLHVGDVISVADADLNINKQIRIVGFSKNLDGSGVNAEISNYREESISKQIRSKLNDTITQLTQTSSQIKQIESNNAGSRLTGGTISKTIPGLQPAEAVTDSMKMEAHEVGKTESQYIEVSQIADYIKSKFGVTITDTKTIWDRDMHITGNITASKEIAAWITGALESTVFSNLTAQEPLYKVNVSTLALRIDESQFEVISGALQIKAGILIPASHSHAVNDVIGLQDALDSKQPSGSYVLTNDSRLSDARNAADVYAWAKAASKPSYNWTEIISRPTALSQFTNDLGNYGGFLTAETDPFFKASPAYGISSGNVSNWNTAYGWGNHAGLYRPYNWVPSWLDITSKPTWTDKITWDAANSRVNISTDLFVTGNIFASKEIAAWIAGAIESDVLNTLTASAPLYKSSATNIQLLYNSTQFEINASNQLQIKAGILTPSQHYHVISDVTGLQSALDGKQAVGSYVLTNDGRLSDARPASDVYAWAKASVKPSYSWSEINSRPGFLSQFTNDSGFITSESDTLASVTGRGNTTYSNLNFYNYVTFTNTGVPQIALNSTGAYYGLLQNDAANTWSLAYGTTQTSLGTKVLTWTPGEVKVNGIGTFTGAISVATETGGTSSFWGSVQIPQGYLSVYYELTANKFKGSNRLVLDTYKTVNPSSNVFLYSQPNDRDAWVFLDSADTSSNWGIYHRQIDSEVDGLPANSFGFIGGGNSTLKAYLSVATGDIWSANNIIASSEIKGYAFKGIGNVSGTGEAIYCPAGIFSTGTNWLYGSINTNGYSISAGSIFSNGTQVSLVGHTHDYATHRADGTNYIDYAHSVYDQWQGGWRDTGSLKVALANSADMLDGFHSNNLTGFQSIRDFSQGTLIQTNIWYADASGDAFLLEIKGNTYGDGNPVDSKFHGYIWSSTIINTSGIQNGSFISGLVAICYNNYLCFWFPRRGYWQGYTVSCTAVTSESSTTLNRVINITDSAKPTSYKEVDLSTPSSRSITTGNYTSFVPTLTGSGASGTWGISITGNASSATNGYYLYDAGHYAGSDGNYLVAWWDAASGAGAGYRNMYHTNSFYFQPATGRLNVPYLTVGQDLIAREIYTSGWLRNDSRTGMYSSSHGVHFYADSASYWRMCSNYGLMFGSSSSYDSAISGYIYHDSGGFGMLNNQGNWAYRIPYDTQAVNFFGAISVNGNATASYMYAYNFIGNSDASMKNTINNIAPEKLKIDYKSFFFNDQPGVLRYGAIAQEVKVNHPELVYRLESGKLGISYQDLLVREVAYLKNKAEQADNTIMDLRFEIMNLKNELNQFRA